MSRSNRMITRDDAKWWTSRKIESREDCRIQNCGIVNRGMVNCSISVGVSVGAFQLLEMNAVKLISEFCWFERTCSSLNFRIAMLRFTVRFTVQSYLLDWIAQIALLFKDVDKFGAPVKAFAGLLWSSEFEPLNDSLNRGDCDRRLCDFLWLSVNFSLRLSFCQTFSVTQNLRTSSLCDRSWCESWCGESYSGKCWSGKSGNKPPGDFLIIQQGEIELSASIRAS